MARIATLHSETLYSLDRAALRAKLAELQARFPNAEVKTRRLPRYGPGYTLTVKGETTEPGVIQRRGHCQFCGNHQVVKDGALVLHGYKRPGHGWVYGRCPGAGRDPLQYAEDLTHSYLAGSHNWLAELEAALPALAAEKAEAEAAYAASGEYAIYSRPQASKRDPEGSAAKLAAWTAKNPATARYLDAQAALHTQERNVRQAKDQITHFETLLGWKLLGTPLVEVEK